MTHFLANDDNPDGYKLEDVLTSIREEIIHRIGKISHDRKPEARRVLENDIKILGLLTEAIELSITSTELLDKTFGPSNSAEPRIGVR